MSGNPVLKTPHLCNLQDYNLTSLDYHNVSVLSIQAKIGYTVNQQILAAIKFDVSQNKVIWWLLNLASPRLCTIDVTYVCWRRQILGKYTIRQIQQI